MAWVSRYVTPTGGGDHSGSSEANALTLPEAAALVGANLSFEVKAGTYALGSTIINLAIAGPRRWRGYQTTPGDLDGEPAGPRVPGVDLPWWQFTDGVVNFNGAQQQASNLALTTARVSAACGIVGEQVRLDRVRVENTGTTVDSTALYCAAANWCASRSWFKAAAGNVVRVDYPGFLVGCVLRGGANGLWLRSGAAVLHCVFDDQGGHGIFYDQSVPTGAWPVIIAGCIVSSSGGNGIYLYDSNATSLALVADCLLTNNATYGIQSFLGPFQVHRTNNDFFQNTSGKESGFGDNPSFAEQVETATPFVNAPGHDFTLVSGAKAVRAGCPGPFEGESYRGYLDIGAVQEPSMTATEVAQAVWNAARASYNTAGSTGEAQNIVIGINTNVVSMNGRLPSTLSGGRMRSLVEAMGADTLTAAALAADAVAEIQAGLATSTVVTDISNRLPAALVSGKMDAAADVQTWRGAQPAALSGSLVQVWIAPGNIGTGAITANAIATGAFTAPKFATDFLTAAGLAADAVAEIQAGLSTLDAAGVRSAIGMAAANLDSQLNTINNNVVTGYANVQSRLPTTLDGGLMRCSVQTAAPGSLDATAFTLDALQEFADTTWDTALALHQVPGSTGAALSDAAAGGSGGGGDPWATPLPGAYPAGSAGQILGALDTVPSDLGEVNAAVGEVKADTEDLQARTPAALSASGRMLADVTGQQVGLTPAAIDAILDEVIEGPFTLRQILRVLFGSQAGKTNGALSPTFNIRDIADTKNRVQANVDLDGNRLSVVIDGS